MTISSGKLRFVGILLITAAGLISIVASNGGSGGGGGQTSSICQQASGTTPVGLGRQGGATSYIYNVMATDPLALCQIKHAKISGVKNNSGQDFSIAHGGAGSPMIILRAGTSTTAFNGQLVEGNWTAQYSGNVNNAPSSLTISVDWVRP